MPAPATVAEFLDLTRKSGLLPDETLDEFVERHRTAGTLPTTIDAFSAALVREGLLTFFQSKQLKLGRYKRFTIGSKYRLLELIGAGGMGAVYLCEHTLMRRLVALKVLPVEKLDDKSNLERFYREARAVAALDHPNIVRAYDIDQFEKLHFLVMEYVDGTSLQEVVARHGPMDPVRAAHYIAQAAVGMQHGHELGMVHRDIKPGNLLLERTGVIKILDMGLARFFNKQQDSVTEKYDEKCVLGTADYLAPEQAVTSVVDVRADIYSLGGTLYFLLTGSTPFPDGTIAAKLVAHQTRDPKPVEAFRSDVPEGILDVLQKMMEKDPDDRFQQPIEVAEALAEWADRPVEMPPTKEMPGLCPAVMALTGHSLDKTSSNSQLARVLFGGGRGSYRSGSGSGSSASNVSVTQTGEVQLSVSGPRSTGRASASPTAPISKNRHDSSEVAFCAPGSATVRPGSGAGITPRGHGRLYATIAVLALLGIGGAVASFYAGKSTKQAAVGTTTGGPVTPPDNDPPLATPTPEMKYYKSDEAANFVGATPVIELRVNSVGGFATGALNSSVDSTAVGNFMIRIAPRALEEAGKTKEAVESEYKNKLIRVHGLVKKDNQPGTFVEVKSLRQILVMK